MHIASSQALHRHREIVHRIDHAHFAPRGQFAAVGTLRSQFVQRSGYAHHHFAQFAPTGRPQDPMGWLELRPFF